jgi:hypothetical protein
MQSPRVGPIDRVLAICDDVENNVPVVEPKSKRHRPTSTHVVPGSPVPGERAALLRLVECPCCMCVKSCPYVECTNGHSVCIECVVKMMHVREDKSLIGADFSGQTMFARSALAVPCPTCRQPVDLTKRSRLLESLVRVAHVCVCEHIGCPLENVAMTKQAATDHDLTCEYKTVPCPFQVNNYLCDNRCNKLYKPGELLKHLRDHHNVAVSMVASANKEPGGKTMAARFQASVDMKARRVSKATKSTRSGTKVCSVMLDVVFADKPNLDGFMAGRQARLYVVKHKGVMYSIYVSLLNTSEHVSVTVRGDFPISVLTSDDGTPPVRICTMYPIQPKSGNGRDIWIEHQSKLVAHCPSFTSLIECEPTHRLAITECGPGQVMPYSVDTGHVVCVPNAEFIADFCNPCAKPSCKCLGHFRVRVEFPDTV